MCPCVILMKHQRKQSILIIDMVNKLVDLVKLMISLFTRQMDVIGLEFVLPRIMGKLELKWYNFKNKSIFALSLF